MQNVTLQNGYINHCGGLIYVNNHSSLYLNNVTLRNSMDNLHGALWFILGQTANNGKSTMFDTLTQILPSYIHTLNSKSLEESYDKKHKWIKATQGKRL